MRSWLDFLRNFNYEQLYWLFEMGIPKRKGDIYDLRESNFKALPPPIFFLSTGRCGTKWFSEFLKNDKQLAVFHAPSPDLAIQSLLAYEQEEKLMDPKLKDSRYISEIFLAGRENYLRYAYKSEKRYVETNNQITYFAPLIARLLPNSLFVHLYRHPGEFVRSGVRRGWYRKDDTRTGLKLIFPRTDSTYFTRWNDFSQLQKISWLWWETNHFIETFKNKFAGRVFDFNFNKLTLENLEELCEKLDISISRRKIKRAISKKFNVQIHGRFKDYKQWTDEDKNKLKQICGDLANQYDYSL